MGREAASVVLIRLWDGDYLSAGERNPDPDSFPEWPSDREVCRGALVTVAMGFSP